MSLFSRCMFAHFGRKIIWLPISSRLHIVNRRRETDSDDAQLCLAFKLGLNSYMQMVHVCEGQHEPLGSGPCMRI